ncbi:endonuclease/exonuclease/phosphatase family protein [Aequorivita antarctica]|uniref:endonuclease/exonuclease/phosphatase family protein n=1 Tax=Aequorivita antarctica TaxID=153266 RepID=UPI0021D15A74|nr:hypothetical protein [Aequorivita antarctica]
MKNLYTVAFYNLENHFNTENDQKKLDDDFTLGKEMACNEKRYSRKIEITILGDLSEHFTVY